MTVEHEPRWLRAWWAARFIAAGFALGYLVALVAKGNP